MAEREILFRGKIINCDLVVSKEWIYGSYCDEAKSPIRLKGEKDYTLCPHISKYDQHYYLKEFGNLGAPYFYEVHPETVGQFTGLIVSNGKVFDGDFLKFGAYILEVFWNGESFQWQAGIVGRSYDRRFRCCGEHRNDNWTVIDLGEIAAEPIITGEMTTEIVGNRWDNPELIPPKPEPIFIF